MFLVKIRAHRVEFSQRHAAGFGSGGFVDQNYGFGLDSEAAMMREDAGDMDPISIAVFVGRAAGRGIGD
jgi:hypothetical protein